MARIGRYEIEREIGRGSMGIVYLAHDPHVRRRVALKTFLLPQGLTSVQEREYSERFLREAQAAGALSHPSIVTIFDADTDPDRGGLPFIVMEYVEGGSLRDLMIRNSRLDPDRALAMTAMLADALLCAHEQGIVHRDIKPANILLRARDGQAKIVDFGVARMSTSELTGAGDVFGSPAYMSPEQFKGATVDARSDLFSLSTILYQTLCGDRPFSGDDMSSLAYSVVHMPARPIASRLPGAPREVDLFFERALAKDPADRFPDAGAFRDAVAELRRALSQHATVAMNPQEASQSFRLPIAAGELLTSWGEGARGMLDRFRRPSSGPAGGAADGGAREPSDGASEDRAIAAVDAPEREPHHRSESLAPSMGGPGPSGIRPLEGAFAVAMLVLAVLPGIWALWSPRSPQALAESAAAARADLDRAERDDAAGSTNEPRGSSSRGPSRAASAASALDARRSAKPPAAPPSSSAGRMRDAATPNAGSRGAAAPAPLPKRAAKPGSAAARDRAAWAPKGSAPPASDLSAAPDGTMASLASPMSRDPLARSLDAARASGYLLIDARSLVKEGLVKLLVDGREVYQRRLSSVEGSGAQPKKFLRRPEETFSIRIEVAPGHHTVAAQVFIEGKEPGHEDAAEIEVGAHESAHLRLVAGRIMGPTVSISPIKSD